MKSWVVSLVSVLLFVSSQANAGHKHRNNSVYYDYGRVIKVRPVFQEISQFQSGRRCYHQSSHSHRHGSGYHNNVLPTVAGAIVGGVVGNSLGRKRNRGATTAAGAVIGGVVGHQLGKNRHTGRNRSEFSHANYCVDTWGQNFQNHHNGKKHNRGKRIKGYHVTYRYKGEKFTTFTRQHPGARIELEVNVRPTRRW